MTTLADAVEIYLKFLRVSLDAGPSTSNPRTEIALLEVMRQALKEERSRESSVSTAQVLGDLCERAGYVPYDLSSLDQEVTGFIDHDIAHPANSPTS